MNYNPSDLEATLLKDIERDDLEQFQARLKTYKFSINTILLSRNKTWETNSLSILSHACVSGSVRIVKYLIEQKAQLQQTAFIKQHKSALHWAVTSEHFECVRLLIEAGADVNALDVHSMAPLLLCCSHANADICKYLIDNGASINLNDRFNCSALDYALLMNNEQVAKELVRNACQYSANVAFNFTGPLKLLVKRKLFNLAKMVVESGAYIQSDIKWVLTSKSTNTNNQQIQASIDKDEEEFLRWLKEFFDKPRTLLSCCRLVIRDLVKGQYLERRIQSLPIPKVLHDYLMMKH